MLFGNVPVKDIPSNFPTETKSFFFDKTDNKYCLVHDDGSYDWILRGIEHYKKRIFNNTDINFWEYGNSGFQIVNKISKEL